MTTREELEILQRATQKAINSGFLQEEGLRVIGVNYTLDPPSIHVEREPLHSSSNNDLYLPLLCPLNDMDWALAFWGKEMKGHLFFGYMPAWQYHQFKLLSFLQQRDWESYINYIALFL